MLSTISPVVAGLSSGHKIGLAAVGVTFILFALVSSFVLPRRNPNFPGKNMGWYVALCVLFFVAMISAVLVFGKEGKEVAGESPAATTDRSGSLPGQTASTDSTPTTTTTAAAPSANGDAAAGKTVFASAGCGGCHTLKAAGSSGNVGPNLDSLKPSQETVAHQVTVGGGGMPAFKGQLSDKQIQDVAAYVSSAAGS
jgi:mono/diheme cytochrome c family protein